MILRRTKFLLCVRAMVIHATNGGYGINRALGPSMAVSLMLSGVMPRIASFHAEAAGAIEPRPDEIPLSEIIRRLENQGYHDFREIERVHGHYEITARNARGKRATVYGNPVTGKLRD